MKLTIADFKHRLLPIIISQLVGIACGIVGVKVTSALVEPSALGLYGVFLTFTTAGLWVVHVGLIKYVTRHWAGTTNRRELWTAIVGQWFRKLPWLLIIALIGAFVIGHPWSFVGIFIASALISLTALSQSALQAAREHWPDCRVSAGASLTRTFAPPLVYFAMGGIWAGLWLGFLGHTIIATLIAAWSLRAYWRKSKSTQPEPIKLNGIYTGYFFTLLAVSGWILSGMNRWLMVACYGTVEGGYFTLASNIALIIPTMVSAIFIQFYQPLLFAGADLVHADRRKLARQVDLMALGHAILSLAGLAVLVQIAPLLIGPLISPAYTAAIPWILPAGCFGIGVGTAQFYHALLLAGRREKACAPVDLGLAALLLIGGIASALVDREWFRTWLLFSPLIPWLYNRTLTNRYLQQTVASQTSAEDR